MFGAEDVERVRRAHQVWYFRFHDIDSNHIYSLIHFQNDLENILPFVLIGGLYITTNPTVFAAKTCFRVFAAARYLHTFVYLFAVSVFVYILMAVFLTCLCLYFRFPSHQGPWLSLLDRESACIWVTV